MDHRLDNRHLRVGDGVEIGKGLGDALRPLLCLGIGRAGVAWGTEIEFRVKGLREHGDRDESAGQLAAWVLGIPV